MGFNFQFRNAGTQKVSSSKVGTVSVPRRISVREAGQERRGASAVWVRITAEPLIRPGLRRAATFSS